MKVPTVLLNALRPLTTPASNVIRVGMVVSGAAVIAFAAWAVIVSLGGGLAAHWCF